MNEWLDRYGFIKTRKHQDSTGNPYLYSVIFYILTINGRFFFSQLWKRELGVLWRTPENTYGQNSHDEYLALAVDHLLFSCTQVPRQVLWSFTKKLGYMKNVPFRKPDPKLKWKERTLWRLKEWTAPWMGRFPNVWLVMIAAAFPNRFVTFFARVLLLSLTMISKINTNDASGMQLSWLNLYAIHLMGNSEPLREFIKKYDMAEIMSSYYDAGHPIIEGYKNFKV